MNLVDAEIVDGTVEFAGFRVPLVEGRRPAASGVVILGIRPEDFEDVAFAQPELPQIEVDVSVIEELGADAHVIFALDAPRVEAEEISAAASHEEEGALIAEDRRALFNARVDPKSEARAGTRIRLAVNPAAFHFFDPQTRLSLSEVSGRAEPPQRIQTAYRSERKRRPASPSR